MSAIVQHIGTQRAVEVYGDRSLTAADVQAQINLMQDVMRSTMIDGTHYGTIPGTKTKSLYKPGAEKLMATFRLACDPIVEDLSANGEVHYRIKVEVRSSSGQLLGAGIGECSSQEDKYAWRAAVCKEEFDATPENRRRVKFAKYNGKVEQKQQVRANPADVANTILKMAKKRGLVDAILTVTAASDIFTQDIEDLPEELREEAHPTPAYLLPENSDTKAKVDACKTAEEFAALWKDWKPETRRTFAEYVRMRKEVVLAVAPAQPEPAEPEAQSE